MSFPIDLTLQMSYVGSNAKYVNIFINPGIPGWSRTTHVPGSGLIPTDTLMAIL